MQPPAWPIVYVTVAAYSVELNAGSRTYLGKFLLWHFIKWAHFERNVPDAVFSFQSCEGCEAEVFLASFLFDPRQRNWRIREWPQDGQNVLIEAQGEPDEDMHTKCLYGVRDYTSDGLDDIATWCRTVRVKRTKTTETVTLYTVSSAGSEKKS